jgi:ATP-binding cassette subfamily B protein RaxB
MIQGHPAECGAVCLGIMLGYYGGCTTRTALREACHIGVDGASLRQIQRGAYRFDLDVTIHKKGIKALARLNVPAIIHWEGSHFVVFERFDMWGRAVINDPATGRRRISKARFEEAYSGICLEATPGLHFRPEPHSRLGALRVSREFGVFAGLSLHVALPVAAVGALTLLQAFVQAVFYDVSLPNALTEWSIIAALVFVAASIILALIESELKRTQVAQHVNLSTRFQALFAGRLFAKSKSFVKSHSYGEILGRIGAGRAYLDSVQALFLALPRILLVTLGLSLLLVAISPLVAAVALLPSLVLMFAHVCTGRVEDEAEASSARAQADIDQLLGLVTEPQSRLRVMGSAHLLSTPLHRAVVARRDANMHRAGRGAFLDTSEKLVAQLSLPAVIFAGIIEISAGRLSFGLVALALALGTVITRNAEAHVALASRYNAALPAAALTAEVLASSNEAERSVEPFLAVPEVVETQTAPVSSVSLFRFEEGAFAFEGTGQSIFDGLNLEIPEKKIVGLVGHSGAGKTTLLEILSGQRLLTSGSVFYRNQPIQGPIGCGFCFADDQFFSGTLGLFFAAGRVPDYAQILECLTIVELEARVGFLAETKSMRDLAELRFSRGEQQRLSLAQALYAVEDTVLIDEAFSHVGLEQAARILDRLRERQYSVLMATQREEIFDLTDIGTSI